MRGPTRQQTLTPLSIGQWPVKVEHVTRTELCKGQGELEDKHLAQGPAITTTILEAVTV